VNIAPTIAIEIDRESETLHAVINDGGEPRTITVRRAEHGPGFLVNDSACGDGFLASFAAACRWATEGLTDDLLN